MGPGQDCVRVDHVTWVHNICIAPQCKSHPCRRPYRDYLFTRDVGIPACILFRIVTTAALILALSGSREAQVEDWIGP